MNEETGPVQEHFICTDCDWSILGKWARNCPECHAPVLNGFRTWGQVAKALRSREQRVIGPVEAAILDRMARVPQENVEWMAKPCAIRQISYVWEGELQRRQLAKGTAPVAPKPTDG